MSLQSTMFRIFEALCVNLVSLSAKFHSLDSNPLCCSLNFDLFWQVIQNHLEALKFNQAKREPGGYFRYSLRTCLRHVRSLSFNR